ncbi:ATP-binding protein [Streptomyces violaceusniger]|uniref:histidine kinase n=1 Tax=Streptomyces violaceusniger (strain Tu 4113) TaxID=653045 RepID=G2P635_STRV4|nr:ATP-binding protein [Streptomyces violaceusniger]AEM85796.1 integral membrane sensor signal transduction histidine kinase [Streptomyces violaceusniger Tu 4113]
MSRRLHVGRPVLGRVRRLTRKLSLRTRVTIWATMVVAIAMIAAGLGLLLGLQHSMWSDRDSTGRQRLSDVTALVRHDRLGSLIPSNGGDADVVEVLDSHGRVAASSDYETRPGSPSDFPNDLPPQVLAGHPATLRGLNVGDGGDFRVLARPIRIDGRPSTIVVGVSLAQAEHTLSSLITGLVIGVPALTALVAWTISLTAGRTLRPVETLRRQAADITATDLHRRLDLPACQDEVQALGVTLNDMLARLDDASVAQRRFVADAAHELRSPLTALRAQLEVMSSYPDPDRDPQMAAALLEDTVRLHDLVEGLLALARSEDPARPRSQAARVIDLDEVVLAEIRRQRSLARADIDARRVSGGRVRGDTEALRCVIRNLLDNARRHASQRVRVTLSERGGTVELTVSDDGSGIAAADRLRVFERFTRLDEARSREAGGSGLGLAIVGKVVTAHGGTAYADQDPAPDDGGLGGALLVIRLPAVPPSG